MFYINTIVRNLRQDSFRYLPDLFNNCNTMEAVHLPWSSFYKIKKAVDTILPYKYPSPPGSDPPIRVAARGPAHAHAQPPPRAGAGGRRRLPRRRQVHAAARAVQEHVRDRGLHEHAEQQDRCCYR